MLCYPEIHRLRAPIYPQVFVYISCRRSGYLLGGVGGEGELWCRLPRGFGLSGYCGLCSPDSPPLLLCPFPPDWLLQSRRLDQASFRFSTFPPPPPPRYAPNPTSALLHSKPVHPSSTLGIPAAVGNSSAIAITLPRSIKYRAVFNPKSTMRPVPASRLALKNSEDC